jgi:GNAT superfamily N-acetyltransferase
MTRTNVTDLAIEPAADHLDLVPKVARWHWESGGWRDPQGSLRGWTEGLLTRTNRDRVPATFFAFVDGALVGSATLVAHDLPHRRDLAHLSPWLAGVVVAREARGRGIGTRLVTHAAARARAFGHARLYLYSEGAERFYERLGWRKLRDDEYVRPITIMAKDLA